jgi:hypothetical protein
MPKPPRRKGSRMTSDDQEREFEDAITGTGDSTAADIAAAHLDDVEDAVEDVARAINVQTFVERFNAIEAKMVEMEQLVATVVGLDLLNNSIQHGFDALGEALQPLRSLVPPGNVGVLDTDDTPKKIETLRLSLAREDLSGMEKLEVPYSSVSYIGAPVSIESPKGEGR